MTEPAPDPIHLWRAAALLRCELKHGEPDNEVLVKMLAHFCERAAQGDERGKIAVEALAPELRHMLDQLSRV